MERRGVTEQFRVLLVGNFLSSSGRQTMSVLEELAAHLSARGWSVLTTSAEPDRVKRLIDMLRTVLQRRHDYHAAMVDVFSGPAFIWAEAVCWGLRLAGKPYLLTLHGGNLPDFSRRWPRRVRWLLSSARAVVAPSRYLYEEMSRYREDLIVLPNAISLGTCRFRVRSSPRPRLIWVRAIHSIYNPGLAVRVVALLAKEFPDIHLTMLGPEREEGSMASVRQLAAQLDVSELIDLPGMAPKETVPVWLDAADILINTTNVDNTPVSVLEGLACGLCVVSTNVGGIPYLLTHERNALLVPPNDAEAMAASIRRILADPLFAAHLSTNARAAAEEMDWNKVVVKWEQLIRSIA